MNVNPPTQNTLIFIGSRSIQKKYRKQRKKNLRKKIRDTTCNKKKQTFYLTMSAWAENFTFAATWQLKHQLAYWKAKAMALEYENGMLHDIIRKKHLVHSTSESSTTKNIESTTQVESESESDEGMKDTDNLDDEFEVSEEFLQFLQVNAKFKEEARREREILKAKSLAEEEEAIKLLEAGPPELRENSEEKLCELYGPSWQRIAALEMSLQSNYINECDKYKPVHWPNVALNFIGT